MPGRPLPLRLLAPVAAALLAACAAPAGDGRHRAGAGPPTVREVYVRALSELGPHRYPDVHIPAVVLDTPPEPLIRPAVMLGDGATPPPPPQPAVRPPPPAPRPVWPRWETAPRRPPAAAGSRQRSEAGPPAETATDRPGDAGGIVSELRLGALKHAVAFGHTAKETGMDGNLEVLFRSPAWAGWAFSPRPTLGLTLNASETNTDFLYGVLTWEWAPAWGLFADLGLGLSIHDGMLDNSQIESKSRFDRREFGCRVLFRESVELGYRFADRHSLSVMWAHHSHASLCSEENEGIDNAGLRYGLRL